MSREREEGAKMWLDMMAYEAHACPLYNDATYSDVEYQDFENSEEKDDDCDEEENLLESSYDESGI